MNQKESSLILEEFLEENPSTESPEKEKSLLNDEALTISGSLHVSF